MTEYESFKQKYGNKAVFWFIYDGLFYGLKNITIPLSDFEKYQAENSNSIRFKPAILERLNLI